jgi:GNAT superfamily N-acetyltransferase
MRIAAEGFGYTGDEERAVSDRFSEAAFGLAGTTFLLAALDGEPAGAASLWVHEGVATLGGMTTVPAARGRGVQGALVRHRLAAATAAGCDLALVTAAPGSVSERNLLRAGFVVLYTLLGVRAGPASAGDLR